MDLVFHKKSAATPKPTFRSTKVPYINSPSQDVGWSELIISWGQVGPILSETKVSFAKAKPVSADTTQTKAAMMAERFIKILSDRKNYSISLSVI